MTRPIVAFAACTLAASVAVAQPTSSFTSDELTVQAHSIEVIEDGTTLFSGEVHLQTESGFQLIADRLELTQTGGWRATGNVEFIVAGACRTTDEFQVSRGNATGGSRITWHPRPGRDCTRQ